MEPSNEPEGSAERPAQAVEPSAFETDSCGALQSDGHGAVLDVVDTLRRYGIDKTIDLPQLVVVGDQSSGKSSVLEAITEIPFPREEGLCTRFATVITLRRHRSSNISVKISPHQDTNEADRQTMESYNVDMTDFSLLPKIIADVTKLMGLKDIGESGYAAFSNHSLCIEINGPKQPALTIVDLPGLIHHGNDIELVFDMVRTYMKNPRSIILAIISGRNDWDNQAVLRLCEEFDSAGQRTLGVITKPDTIPKRDVHNWIDLAQNRQPGLQFERGWHVLKNRGPDEVNSTFAERNKAEKSFFNKDFFKDLPRDSVGIEALRKRLSKIIFHHLVQTLPSVRQDIVAKLNVTKDELQQLGEKRTTVLEQRTVLVDVAQKCNNLLRSAVSGIYADSFFLSISMEAAPDHDVNINRFRNVIQHMNMDYANVMQLKGSRREVRSDPEEDVGKAQETHQDEEHLDGMSDESLGASLPMPEIYTRAQAIQWVKKYHVRGRGSKLPGTVPPALVGDLFRDLSASWESITVQHIDRVALKSKEFVYKVIEYCASPEFLSRLADYSVDAALTEALENCIEELKNIIKDQKGPPMTYSAAWIIALQKTRQKKHANLTKQAISSSVGTSYAWQSRAEIDTNKLQQEMAKGINTNLTKFTAEEALDMALAYYNESVKTFINNVAVQVIERHLVRGLPDIVLSPVKITTMSEEDIEYIAAETQDITMKRNMLERRKQMLEKGLQIFREAVGSLRG